MNKHIFKILISLMTISLIGIILVQVYWIKASFDNNEEQFRFHIKQVIGNVAAKLEKQEKANFYNKYERIVDKTGKTPEKEDLMKISYIKKDGNSNETIVYSNVISSEDHKVSSTNFGDKYGKLNLKSFSAKRKTEIFSGNSFDNPNNTISLRPTTTIEKYGFLDNLKSAQYDIAYKDLLSVLPIEDRISKDIMQKTLAKELKDYDVNTPFVYSVYNNNKPTNISSNEKCCDLKTSFSIPIFVDSDGSDKYKLLIDFPQKKKYLFSELIGISALSIIFTLIIIIVFASTLHQLSKQKLISEIKTDFINNMTHEFKTPIATINLALSSIKSPKVINDNEKVLRYLQMIGDENKRMHAQVENVLRISKLERKNLDIEKQQFDIQQVVEDAIDHVHLIIEDRNGVIKTDFQANRKIALLNEMHFTNVIVNILDNAIKYSTQNPEILIETQNVKDFLILKISDKGIGMSKTIQKRIFEKFYREHTGDLHNVKGHGLGLSYVKRIVEDHNCQIFVESEKGYGSCFIIKIPLIN